eukprot:1086293-Pelagomonas_calceolata.AAC.5
MSYSIQYMMCCIGTLQGLLGLCVAATSLELATSLMAKCDVGAACRTHCQTDRFETHPDPSMSISSKAA